MRAQLAFDGRGDGVSVVTASLEEDAEGLCWHPLVYEGVAEQPSLGQFEVTPRHSEEYLASFNAGIPGPGGIPIDERADHRMDPDGAFGWITRLARTVHEVRDRTMQAVSGAIQWTPRGKRVLADGDYKYVSSRFTLDKPNDVYGVRNVIKAAALCTRPVFWWQPQVEWVAAQEVSLEELRSRRQARSKHWGIEVREDGRLTPAAAYRAAAPNPEHYADPVNLKYPLKPEANLRNAPARFAQNYGRYSEASRRIIYTRIVRALKAAGIKHSPNPTLDKLLPPDLRSWVEKA